MATYDFVVKGFNLRKNGTCQIILNLVSNIPGDATRYDLAMLFASCVRIRNARFR